MAGHAAAPCNERLSPVLSYIRRCRGFVNHGSLPSDHSPVLRASPLYPRSSLFLMNLALVVLYVQFAKSDAALRSRAAAAAKARAKAQRRASRGELGSGSQGGGAADLDLALSHGGSTTSSDSEAEEGPADGADGADGKGPGGKGVEGQHEEGKEGGGGLNGWVRRLAGGGRVAPRQPAATQGAHGEGGRHRVYGSMYGGAVSSRGGRSHGGRQGCWRHTHALLHAAARSRWLQVLTLVAILVNTVIMCINW